MCACPDKNQYKVTCHLHNQNKSVGLSIFPLLRSCWSIFFLKIVFYKSSNLYTKKQPLALPFQWLHELSLHIYFFCNSHGHICVFHVIEHGPRVWQHIISPNKIITVIYQQFKTTLLKPDYGNFGDIFVTGLLNVGN